MDGSNIGMGISRYQAMAGLLEGVPDGVARRAKSDRAMFGSIYLYHDPTDGKFRWSSPHVVRFLVEVCGLSYVVARAALIAELREFDVLKPPLPDPAVQARDMFRASGNILEAVETARIEADAWCHDPVMARHTHEVLFYVQGLAFVSDQDLSDDWQG